MFQIIYSRKWNISFRVIPFVLVILVIKLFIHAISWEFLTLSSLFGALISANVFLVGFLISGVLVDYKESEKIPGELACNLEALVDECSIVQKSKKTKITDDLMQYLYDLTTLVEKWFQKKESTQHMFEKISNLNEYFLALEPLTQANFITRMKQEQNSLRKIITRVHTIRETSFNPAGYAIAEIISTILCIGLIFTRIDPYYESVFFVAFVSFILIYMIFLIKDIDNPFGYYAKEKLSDVVSLKPLLDLQTRIKHKYLK